MASALHSTSRSSLPRGKDWWWAAWGAAAACGCYFCIYGFRRPFTAASYSSGPTDGLAFKTVLVTSQVSGYMLAKFLGIKFIAELPPRRRAAALLVQVLLAEATLVLFGLLPRPWNAVGLFFNGLSLGMVFGVVLRFLEGRRTTEALVAGLCTSFILADGVTKSVGAWLLAQGVVEEWMPATAGLLFLTPVTVFVAMLAYLPEPTTLDIEARAERAIMTGAERRRLVRRYAPGLIPLVLMYLAVTIVRSLRADFAPEIWRELGGSIATSTFARCEFWVALGVLLFNGSAILIADNRRALLTSLLTCGAGILVLALTLVAREAAILPPFGFMALLGLGLYLPYVAIHTTVFERLLAVTREPGNLGFLMYLADSIGYLGYVAVMLFSQLGGQPAQTLNLLVAATWLTVVVAGLCICQAIAYFARLPVKTITQQPELV